jgi:hypothetical protein
MLVAHSLLLSPLVHFEHLPFLLLSQLVPFEHLPFEYLP